MVVTPEVTTSAIILNSANPVMSPKDPDTAMIIVLSSVVKLDSFDPNCHAANISKSEKYLIMRILLQITQ
jgi:hypothetical protein